MKPYYKKIHLKHIETYVKICKNDIHGPKSTPPELSLSAYDRNFARNPCLTTRRPETCDFDPFLAKLGSKTQIQTSKHNSYFVLHISPLFT